MENESERVAIESALAPAFARDFEQAALSDTGDTERAVSMLISIVCSCYFNWDDKTVRGEIAIGRGASRHNLVFGRSIAT